jgi:nicotinamide-nucleotide adenylyltransferase
MKSGAVCFTGRFQPFHKQHLEVVEAIRDDYAHVIIGITNPDLTKLSEHVESSHRHTDQSNPFDFETRREIVLASLGDLTDIEIIPLDLETPDSWQVPSETTFALRIFSPWELSKQVLFELNGYATQLIAPPENKLSASSIREQLASGDISWQEQVCPGAFEQILTAWNNAVALRVGS